MCIFFRPICNNHPEPLVIGPLQLWSSCSEPLDALIRAAEAMEAYNALKAKVSPPKHPAAPAKDPNRLSRFLNRLRRDKVEDPAVKKVDLADMDPEEQAAIGAELSALLQQCSVKHDPENCVNYEWKGYVEISSMCRECNGANETLLANGWTKQQSRLRTVEEVEFKEAKEGIEKVSKEERRATVRGVSASVPLRGELSGALASLATAVGMEGEFSHVMLEEQYRDLWRLKALRALEGSDE